MNGKLKVGDTLWVVSRWRKDEGHAETVERIGRLYAYLSSRRKVNIGTLDGYAMDSNYLFFRSQKHHQRHLEENRAQVALMDRMKRFRLTLEQIQAVNELLGWKTP